MFSTKQFYHFLTLTLSRSLNSILTFHVGSNIYAKCNVNFILNVYCHYFVIYCSHCLSKCTENLLMETSLKSQK